MNAPKRKLGNSGLEVGPLAFGGNVFGWTIDEPMSFQMLDAFVGAGFNLIDTADVYSRWAPGNRGGESETIIGNWLNWTGKRAAVVIATKVGMEMGPNEKGLSKKYIFQAVERSLRRLRTDYIDLYQSHVDDQTTPIEEVLGAYSELIKQGKVRAIGASNFSAERLAASLQISEKTGLPRYECLQPHYNLCEREYETSLEPICRQRSLGVIPYFSLASGFLTGKYRSEQDIAKFARGARVQKYLNEHGIRILQGLDQVASRFRSTPSRVAIAWLLTRTSVTAPIASATNLDQFNDLIEATRLVLDGPAIETLNEVSIPAPKN